MKVAMEAIKKDSQRNVAGIDMNFRLILTYSIVLQPLKSFDCPLMRVSLSNSILVTLIFY